MSLEARHWQGLRLPDLKKSCRIFMNHLFARDQFESPLPRLIGSRARGSAKMAQTIRQTVLLHARMKTLRQADLARGTDTL